MVVTISESRYQPSHKKLERNGWKKDSLAQAEDNIKSIFHSKFFISL